MRGGNPFQEGDRVRCIGNKNHPIARLDVGKIYIIGKYYLGSNGYWYSIEGSGYAYFGENFEPDHLKEFSDKLDKLVNE